MNIKNKKRGGSMSSKIFLGLVICFFLQFKLSAQITFSPVGDGFDVKENTSYTFTANFTLPSDFDTYSDIWWYENSGHAHFNNSSIADGPCQVLASSPTAQTKTVTIYWDENTYYETDNTIDAYMDYCDKGGEMHSMHLSKLIHVLAIGNSMYLSGPTSLVKGCTQTAIYTVSYYWDATQFAWTVPSGFTINSGNNTNTIHVTVNPVASGVIKCIASIVGSPPSTNKTAQISVTRTNPIVSISSPYDICPGKSYTISLTGDICGITSVVWSAPTNCIITGAGTGTSATLTLSANNSSVTTGNISATAYYSTYCTASATCGIKLHTNAIPPIPTNSFDVNVTKYCTPSDPMSIVEFIYTGVTDPNVIVTINPKTLHFKRRNEIRNVIVTFRNPCTNVSKSRTFSIQAPLCKQK